MNQQQTQYFFNRISEYPVTKDLNQPFDIEIDETFKLEDVLNKAFWDYSRSTGTTKPLRPDAVFLLLLNFDQVIYRPLSLNVSNSKFGSRLGLLQAIYSDVTLILQEANYLSADNPDNQISGHMLLLAVTNKWPIFNTLSKGSW